MSQKTFRLPDLGEGLTESEIVTWRVAEGDAVSVNQVLADVETAKAVVEVSSPFAGVVAALDGRGIGAFDPGQDRLFLQRNAQLLIGRQQGGIDLV